MHERDHHSCVYLHNAVHARLRVLSQHVAVAQIVRALFQRMSRSFGDGMVGHNIFGDGPVQIRVAMRKSHLGMERLRQKLSVLPQTDSVWPHQLKISMVPGVDRLVLRRQHVLSIHIDQTFLAARAHLEIGSLWPAFIGNQRGPRQGKSRLERHQIVQGHRLRGRRHNVARRVCFLIALCLWGNQRDDGQLACHGRNQHLARFVQQHGSLSAQHNDWVMVRRQIVAVRPCKLRG